jgi:hypothetical protein
LAAGRKWRFKAVGGSRGKSNLGATPRADDVAVWPEATDAPLPRKAPLLAEPCGASSWRTELMWVENRWDELWLGAKN